MPTPDINLNLFLPRGLVKNNTIFSHFMKIQFRIFEIMKERFVGERKIHLPGAQNTVSVLYFQQTFLCSWNHLLYFIDLQRLQPLLIIST